MEWRRKAASTSWPTRFRVASALGCLALLLLYRPSAIARPRDCPRRLAVVTKSMDTRLVPGARVPGYCVHSAARSVTGRGHWTGKNMV